MPEPVSVHVVPVRGRKPVIRTGLERSHPLARHDRRALPRHTPIGRPASSRTARRISKQRLLPIVTKTKRAQLAFRRTEFGARWQGLAFAEPRRIVPRQASPIASQQNGDDHAPNPPRPKTGRIGDPAAPAGSRDRPGAEGLHPRGRGAHPDPKGANARARQPDRLALGWHLHAKGIPKGQEFLQSLRRSSRTWKSSMPESLSVGIVRLRGGNGGPLI